MKTELTTIYTHQHGSKWFPQNSWHVLAPDSRFFDCFLLALCLLVSATEERSRLRCILCSGACGGSSLFAILAEGETGMEKAEKRDVLVVYVAYITMFVLEMVGQVSPTPGKE